MAQALLLNRGWDFEIERGPDWLFVRPRRVGSTPVGAPSFAEQVWSLLEQQFANRLVLEMDDIDRMDSDLVGQLVCLYKRIHTHDGVMRICGLSHQDDEVLRMCRLGGHFPRYDNREDAVMGRTLPRHPR